MSSNGGHSATEANCRLKQLQRNWAKYKSHLHQNQTGCKVAIKSVVRVLPTYHTVPPAEMNNEEDKEENNKNRHGTCLRPDKCT